MRRALLIATKPGMKEKDVEAVARSQARKIFRWDRVLVSELLKTKNRFEVVAVVESEVFQRLWNFMEGEPNG